MKKKTDKFIKIRSGKSFYYLSPKSNQFTLEDLIWSLSRLPRFLGHTIGKPYSVLQHLCLCYDLAPQECKKEALCHDFSEALTGDIVSPLKALLPDYRKIESEIEKVLAKKFNLQYPYPQKVKEIDLIALATEIKCLTNRKDYKKLPYKAADKKIQPWSEEKSRREFIKRWLQCHP